MTNRNNSVHINTKYAPLGYFSIKGDGTDETANIQALFNYVISQGGGEIYFSASNYGFTQLKLLNTVSIVGTTRTHFNVLPSSYTSAIIIEEQGPISGVHYENFIINGLGSTNLNQNGLDLTALAQQVEA